MHSIPDLWVIMTVRKPVSWDSIQIFARANEYNETVDAAGDSGNSEEDNDKHSRVVSFLIPISRTA